jgi:hypothetical protein
LTNYRNAGLRIPGLEVSEYRPRVQTKGLQIDLSNPFSTGESSAKKMYQASEGSAQKYYNQASPNIPMPGKTLAGGLTSGLAGGGAGSAIGSAIAGGTAGSIAPGVGTAIGAGVGILGYYFS